MSKTAEPTEPDTLRDVPRYIRRLLWLRSFEISAVLKETLRQWSSDNAQRLGASLAFYTLLSLAPLLVVTVAVAALAYGEEAARGQLFGEIRNLVGSEEAQAIQALIQNAYRPGPGMIATVLSVVTLAFGATTVVVELRDALNTIWKVSHPCERSCLSSVLFILKERFYAFGVVLGTGFLLLTSLVLNAWLAALEASFRSLPAMPESILNVVIFLASFLLITCLFAAIYKILPDVRLKWSDVVVGASVTSLLFTIGKQLIGLYLGKAGFGSTYGAAGSLVVVLVWVYYSAQLFFLGAEFTKVYTKTFGSQLAAKLEAEGSEKGTQSVRPARHPVTRTPSEPIGRGGRTPLVLFL